MKYDKNTSFQNILNIYNFFVVNVDKYAHTYRYYIYIYLLEDRFDELEFG